MIVRRTSFRSLLVLLLLLAVPVIVFPQPAFAESCGTSQNLQAGFSTNYWSGSEPLTYEGASAVILDRGGYVLCTSDTNGGRNFSTTWTMVFGNTGGWAQSGTMYRFGYGSCVKRWAEQRQTPTGSWGDYYIGGCSAVGESHRYWQQALYVSGNWVMRSNIDTTVIHQSGWSPFANWARPFQVAYSAETYYAQSHIPGTTSAPQDWSSMQVQRYDNDTFVGTCNNVYLGKYNQNSTRWGNDAPACNHIRSWTK